jgi:quinol-cytochrome oxidoreductase complex cytochrome b subunit
VTEPIAVPAPEVPRYRWYHIAAALIFIVFCMELGIFLAVFPWSEFWERSFFSSLAPEWRLYWENAYLRGAVSGLGILNVYIALVEIFRLRRFARRS